MKKFNYSSLDYLTVTRKLLDDTVWTTIDDNFIGSDDGTGTVAHGTGWFTNLFDSGNYKIDGTDSSFHNHKFVKFLDKYTSILIKPFDEAIEMERQIIVQMSLHPRTENVDWILTHFFDPLFKKYPSLHQKLKDGQAHLLLFFGWEADNFSFSPDGKRGDFQSYYNMFDTVIERYELSTESIIILNSNLRGYEQEEEYYGQDLSNNTNVQVIYESAFEINTFKSQKGIWNPTYTFDEHIENLKGNDVKKMLRINRTQLGCRDMMLYWLENTKYIKDTIIEHRANEKYNDSFFQKELNPWLERGQKEQRDYYAIIHYLEECTKICKNLDLNHLIPQFEYNHDIVRQIKSNSPYIASKDEILGNFSDLYSNEYIPIDVYYKSIFSWVSTSLTGRNDQVFMNASTFQPMLHYHPMIFNSNPFHNNYLKLHGFKDYSWFSDPEITDTTYSKHERMVLNVKEIEKLMNKSNDELINIIVDNRESLEYNRKLLFECKSVENIVKKLFVIINKKYMKNDGSFAELKYKGDVTDELIKEINKSKLPNLI